MSRTRCDSFSARSNARINPLSTHIETEERLLKSLMSPDSEAVQVACWRCEDSSETLVVGNRLSEVLQESQISKAFFHMANTTSSTENASRKYSALCCKHLQSQYSTNFTVHSTQHHKINKELEIQPQIVKYAQREHINAVLSILILQQEIHLFGHAAINNKFY